MIAQSLPDVTRVYFDPLQDTASTALNAAVSRGARINSLLIFSHGDAGHFSLGNELIDTANIDESSSRWRDLSQHFVKGASIDLFACDLASSQAGESLLDRLHQLTGARVYGSTDLTGRGGDWVLEAHSKGAGRNDLQADVDTKLLGRYPSDLLITTTIAAASTPSPVTGTTAVLSVTMLDTLGVPTFGWTTTSKPSGSVVSFSNNNSTTATITTATFNKAGSYTLSVTGTDGGATNSSSVTVTVNQTLTSISVTPATASLSLNTTQNFSASASDQFGNAMATQPTLTWSRTGVGSINASGSFTSASVIGTSIVSATSGAISGTATVAVANAAPTIATAAAASVGTVTGHTVGLSVLGSDDGGESNLIYSWVATSKPSGSAPVFSINGLNGSKSTTVTFYTAGSYTFQATIADLFGATVTSSVNVTVSQTLTTIIVSPATPALHLNQTQAFADTALDQFGNSISSAPTITWSLGGSSVGSINAATGLFASGTTPGSAIVDATSAGIVGVDTVTVTNALPTIATAAAATPSMVTGTTSVLSVLGADDGEEANLSYTWTTTSKPSLAAFPTFSINGTNGAKNCTATFSQAGVYILQVTVTDGFGASCTSSVALTVVQGNPNVTVASGTTALNLNQSQLFTATAYDQFGNALTVQPVFTWSLGAGSVGSINSATGIYNSGGLTGNATIVATSGSYSSSEAVTVSNAAPTVAVAAACTPGMVTGITAALSVLGADDGGESNLTYTWSATTKPTGATPSFFANGTNASKVSTVTFNQAGTYVLTAVISDGSLSTTSTVSVTVSQTTSSITVTPNTAALNENATQQFSAVAFDQFGTAMATQPVFTWSTFIGSLGTISSTGVYTAPQVAGSATVVVTAGTTTGSAAVTITNAPPTLAVAAAASPATVTGTTTSLSVLGADDGGEPNLFYTWSATTKPTGSTVSFSANGVNVAKNSTATFSAAGNYVLTAVISDGAHSVSSNVSVTVTQTVNAITLNPSTTALHENATQQFSAIAFDQFGVALATQPTFTWSKTSGVGSIDSNGLFSTTTAIGAAVVEASTAGVSATASVIVVNAAPTVATAASAAQTTVTGLSTTLSVLGADDGGESGLTYTWTATVAPSGATTSFSINSSNAAKLTVASFSKPGAYLLTAIISDGSSTVNSTVAVTVVATATTLSLTPATVSLAENATQVFTAIAYDQFGLAVIPQPLLAWSKTSGIGTFSALGTYTAPGSPGSAVVSVSGGGFTSTAAVTVVNMLPTVVTAATATPSTVIGTTSALSVLGADDGGESNLTYTWSATSAPSGGTAAFSVNGTNAAKSSTATFNKAGTFILTATISDGSNSVTSAVPVIVGQTLATISVTPATSSLQLNQSTQLTATAYDQFGNLMSPQPAVLWTVIGGGSATQTGLYTSAGSAVSATVYASIGSVSGSAAVNVTNGSPTVATAALANPTNVTGLTTTLSVLGADDGGAANLSYNWSAVSPAGATPVFSLNGTNSAKSTVVTFNALGNYTFTATITDAFGASVTSSVAVTVGQTLTAITVSPLTKTLSIGSAFQFSTTAWDQFGNAMSTQPTFTWAVTSGGGSVSTAGLFTAGGSAGTSVISASSGSVSGSATVTTVNSLAITATVNSQTGTSAALGVLGLSGSFSLNWSVTAQPPGGSAAFDTTTGNTPTLSFSAAGNYTVQLGVTIAGATTNLTDSFTVSQLLTSITVTPQNASVNENQSVGLSAIAFDQFGVAMAQQPTFGWSVILGDGSIAPTGLYTSGSSAGNATIRATSGSVYSSTTVTTVNAPPVVATPAAASPALVTGTSTSLSVLGSDDGGEASLQYTWSVAGSPANAAVTFSNNGNSVAKNTTATFNRAGAYTLLVTISDGNNTTTSAVSATVIQTASFISVAPSSTTVNETSSDVLTATVYDQFGNSLTAQGSVTWSETDGLGTVNSTGLFIAGTTAGSADVRASVGSVFADVPISIVHGAPIVAIPVSASPPTVSGTSAALSVLGSDENGESTLNYSWTTTAAPTGATPSFSANGTNPAKSTVVAFNQAGSYVFTVTISNGSSSTSSSVSVTVNQTISSITVSPATAGMNLQSTQQFAALEFDQFGRAMLSAPTLTWSVKVGPGTVTSSGLFSSGSSAGSADVWASAGGVHGDANVTVTDAAPTLVDPASASPALVAGTSTQLSVLANDDNGESNLTYTWASTAEPDGAAVAYSENDSNGAKNVTAYFNEAGAYTFAVTSSDGNNNIVSTVDVTVVQTMTSISVIPPSAALSAQSTQQLFALAKDQFGSAVANQPTFNWTLPSGSGSVTPGGLYTAGPTDNIAKVKAQVGNISATSTITVFGAPPVIVADATAVPSIVTGTSTELSVTASTTGSEPLTFDWQMTSGPAGASPQIMPDLGSPIADEQNGQANVVFNAGGDYVFEVTVSDGVESAVSSVTVSVDATLSSLDVIPRSGTMDLSASQQITVAGYDQFDALLPTPSVNWSVASGAGSIGDTGIFLSAATPGTTNIIAIDGNLTGSAAVEVEQYLPVVTQMATADSQTVTGTSVELHARGSEWITGDTGLTYDWTQISGPSDPTTDFSPNNANAARDTMVTFDQPGDYILQANITDSSGQSVMTTVEINVVQTVAQVNVTVPQTTVDGDGTAQAIAQVYDQFALPITAPVVWSVDADSAGTVDADGLFTSPNTNGMSTLRATSGSVSGTAVVLSSAIAPDLVVDASYIQPDPGGTSGVLSATATGDANSDISFHWEIISQPTTRAKPHSVSAAPAEPLAVFAINNSALAQDTPVTFKKPGEYIFRVTATEGALSASQDIQVLVTKGALNSNLTVVADDEPLVQDGSIYGYRATFSGPVEAATADDIRAYRVTQVFGVPKHRSSFDHLFGLNNNNLNRISRAVTIASAVYDPEDYSVTILFTKPLDPATCRLDFHINGAGKHGIRDGQGIWLDGTDTGKPGGSFLDSVSTHVGTNFQVDADGSIGTIRLYGPGTLTVIRSGDLPPLIALKGCDPATSVLVGTVTNRRKNFKPQVISAVLDSQTASIQLGDGFVLEG